MPALAAILAPPTAVVLRPRAAPEPEADETPVVIALTVVGFVAGLALIGWALLKVRALSKKPLPELRPAGKAWYGRDAVPA
jgi:hypothetical protein